MQSILQKKEIWKLSKYCVSKGTEDSIHNPVKSGKLLLPLKNCPDAKLAKDVLDILRDDDIKLAVSSDNRILEYSKRLVDRHGHEAH